MAHQKSKSIVANEELSKKVDSYAAHALINKHQNMYLNNVHKKKHLPFFFFFYSFN